MNTTNFAKAEVEGLIDINLSHGTFRNPLLLNYFLEYRSSKCYNLDVFKAFFVYSLSQIALVWLCNYKQIYVIDEFLGIYTNPYLIGLDDESKGTISLNRSH